AMAALQLEGLRGSGSSSCFMSTPSLAPSPEIYADARTEAESKGRAKPGERPAGARRLDDRRIGRCPHTDGAGRAGYRRDGVRAVRLGVDAREFRAKQEYLRRVVNPHHHYHERAGCAERGGDGRSADVE